MVPLQPLSKSDSYHDCRLDSHDSCLLNIIFNQGRCACTFASKMRVCAHAPPHPPHPPLCDQVEESMWLGTVWSLLNKVVLELIILFY